jgi:hypothetical protein
MWIIVEKLHSITSKYIDIMRHLLTLPIRPLHQEYSASVPIEIHREKGLKKWAHVESVTAITELPFAFVIELGVML